MKPETARSALSTPKPLALEDVLERVNVGFDNDVHTLKEAIDNALAGAVKAVVKNNKKGTVTIQIVIEPNRHNEVDLAATVAAKLPQPKALPSPCYVDKRGRLCDGNPEQPTFENVTLLHGGKDKEE